MTRTLVCILLIGAVGGPALAATAPRQQVTDIDRVIAVVNDQVITANELDSRMAETKQQLVAEKIKLPPDEVLRRQILERIVVEQIQLQLASQTGIRVNDQDIDSAIRAIAGRNKMSVDALYETVHKQGFDRAAYREQIQNQISIQQLIDREITNHINVSENEVNNFIENARAHPLRDSEYNLSHIYIPLPESASPEQLRATEARVEDIQRQLKAGEDFARAAVTYSQGPDALKGGALGWKSPAQLPELFVTAIAKLKVGDVSETLRGPNGFHILRLNDRRGSAVVDEPIQETHVRHILLRPSEIQSLGEAKEKLLQIRTRLLAGQDFATTARENSEDTVSTANGGDLGWVRPKQLVPEFEQAMNALAPGAISEPVQTPFGVHLIQVLERREQTVADDQTRTLARNQIRARKADERYEQWLRQLRDEAYVEYLFDDSER